MELKKIREMSEQELNAAAKAACRYRYGDSAAYVGVGESAGAAFRGYSCGQDGAGGCKELGVIVA